MDADHAERAEYEAARFQKLLRARMLSSLLLIAIGATSLYLGFRDDSALMLTAGVVFLVYAGIIQVRTWAVRRFIRESSRRLKLSDDSAP